MTTSLRTLIFVPTYNERDNVERMVRELTALGLEADLLFMDDSSPDGTGDILDELAGELPSLSVVHRTSKLGIGSAHLAGIDWAYDNGYQRLVTLDCDFTHDPGDLNTLIQNSAGFDVTVGSRYLRAGSLPGWNALRRSLTGFGHVLTRYVLGIPFDSTGALRLYDLERIPRGVFARVKSQGYGFFFESMFVLVRSGCSVGEFPIVLPARTYGSSKMTIAETVRSGRQLLALRLSSIIRPDRHRIVRGLASPEPGPVQGWDAYWSQKTKPASKLYDSIASAYRTKVIRRELERAITANFPAGSFLLHAGCGSGQVDKRLHERVSITAVDLSPAALDLYRRHNPAATAVRQADIFSLPFPDESFDGAYNLGVLEHFTTDEIDRILGEIRRVLKGNGKLVVFWPHARATSVAVLGAAHWLLNSGSKTRISLHPPEISLLRGRKHAEEILRRAGFSMCSYAFGARDFFVQAVVVGQKSTPRD